MQTKKVTFLNRKSCELRVSKAVVLSTSRDSETYVHGGGGGGRIIGGGGVIHDITIQSTVIEHFRIWIRYLHNGQEQEIDIGDSRLTCREGHEVYVCEGRSSHTSNQYEIVSVRNETTNISYFVPNVINAMQRLGLVTRPKRLSGGSFILLWAASILLLGGSANLPGVTNFPWVTVPAMILMAVPVIPTILLVAINSRLQAAWMSSTEPMTEALNKELRELIKLARQAAK